MKTKPTVRLVAPAPWTPTVRLLSRLSKKDKDSIETQNSDGRAFAAKIAPGAPVVVYSDNGVSGDDFNRRTAMLRLVEEAKAGDIVVCRDETRVARNIYQGMEVVRRICLTVGARLFFYSENFEVSAATPTDTVINMMKFFRAESELQSIRKNTSRALVEIVNDILSGKSAPTRVINGACYGYRIVQRNGESHYEIDEKEAVIVRRIFAELLAGRGISRIINGLNADGVPPPCMERNDEREGRLWAPNTAGGLLARERYRGMVVWGATKVQRRADNGDRSVVARDDAILRIEAPTLRIVDDTTWFAVQAERARRAETAPRNLPGPRNGEGTKPAKVRGNATKYALSGWAKCTHCGSPFMVRVHTRGCRKTPKYACYGHFKSASSCPVALLQPVEEVERAIVEKVHLDLMSDTMVERLVRAARAEMDRMRAAPNTDLATKEAELAEQRKLATRYMDLMGKLADPTEAIERHNETTARIAALTQEIKVAKLSASDRKATEDALEGEARRRLTSIRDKLLSADRQIKRDAFEALFPGGLYFAPVYLPKEQQTRWRREVFKITGRPDILAALATVKSKHNSSEFRFDLTDASARKSKAEMVVVALPRAA